MSKNKSKKKKDETPVIPVYRPENLIESLQGTIIEEEKNINNLMDTLTKKKFRIYKSRK